jgi:colicin import membrane protein
VVLTLREYGLPLLLAAALHALTVVALYSGWSPTQQESRIIKPQIVRSTLVMLEPKAKPKPAPRKAPPKVEERAQPKPEPESKPVEVKTEPEPDLQAQRRRAEDAERQTRLEELAQASFLDALEIEATDLAESNAASEAEIVAQSYRYGIYQRVVANWSRPPSARNGMQAKLQVELVPTGDVVAVTLLEGSGNGAFDRSAEAAVQKSRRFEVPVESDIFERYFRRFTLLFRPEDLLR